MIVSCSDNTSIVKRELNPKIWRRVKEYLVAVNIIILSDQGVLCLRIQKKCAGTSIDQTRLLVRNTEILRLKGEKCLSLPKGKPEKLSNNKLYICIQKNPNMVYDLPMLMKQRSGQDDSQNPNGFTTSKRKNFPTTQQLRSCYRYHITRILAMQFKSVSKNLLNQARAYLHVQCR